MPDLINVLVSLLVFAAGLYLTAATFTAAVRTVVIPRAENVWTTRWVYRVMLKLFRVFTDKATTYEQRDGIMAYYSPMSIMLLIIMWLFVTTIGFTLMYWSIGVRPLYDAFWLSGSSLLTLGFRTIDNLPQMILAFADAALGLIYIALLIAYLPTIYAEFSKREMRVNMLEIRAGVPFSSVEMLKRFHRLDRMDKMIEVWYEWEEWFVELEQTHTSLPMLVFLRSPSPRRSWITAAGTVMDTAALMLATVDHPDAQDAQASICIRAGYIALRAIADFFNIPYDPDPMPSDAISIDRSEFDDVIAELRRAGVPLVDDIDQAWQDFRGWRVNYDGVLLAIANLTMAPYAAWISDRSAVRFGPSNLTDPIAAEAIRTAAPTPD